MTDGARLVVAGGIRAVATGMMGIVLGLYLAKAGLAAEHVGLVVSAGLAGQAVATVAVTLAGDRLGRRRALLAVSGLTAAGSVLAAATSSAPWLAAAAAIGMLNGMGRDRGAALVLEQAALPATTSDAGRTRAFARYHLVQDAGAGVGALMAGLPVVLVAAGIEELAAWRGVLLLHATLALAMGAVYAGLSRDVEVEAPRLVLSPGSRSVLARVSALFLVDALAGGFLTASLIAYFFFERFGVGAATIGLLFALARVANAVSHLGAAWLARRIGLVNTMVFTHIPSSVLLLTVAIAPSFPVAAALFLLREGLVEMDVPTRSSYVMAMIRPEERTLAAGVTSLVRVAGWAIAPAFAGVLIGAGSLAAPLVIAAGMKIAYDLLLWWSFRHLPPPEERTLEFGGGPTRP